MYFVEDFAYIDALIKRGVKNAVIDVDNTITKSNIVQFYMFIKKKCIKNKLAWMLFYLIALLPFPFMWCWI